MSPIESLPNLFQLKDKSILVTGATRALAVAVTTVGTSMSLTKFSTIFKVSSWSLTASCQCNGTSHPRL